MESRLTSQKGSPWPELKEGKGEAGGSGRRENKVRSTGMEGRQNRIRGARDRMEGAAKNAYMY